MVLPTNRAALDPIYAQDINEIAAEVNTLLTRIAQLGGGLSGQTLAKLSDASYDYAWRTFAGGGGGGGSSYLVTVASADTPIALKSAATYVCDGIADEEEIQGAIDELPSTGGWVQLLAGNFNLTAPIRLDHHGIALVGSGVASLHTASQLALGTRLSVAEGFSGAAVVLAQLVADNACISSITLRDFTVDGGAVTGGQAGILLKAHTSSVSDVRVARTTGDGLRMEGYDSWAAYDNVLTRVIASNNLGAGIHLSTNAQDAHLTNNIAFQNTNGIRIRGASHQITAAHIYNNDNNGIHFDNNGSRTKILGLKCEGNQHHGILFDNTTAGTSDVKIGGASSFKNNGEAATNTYDHISFGQGTAAHTRATISDCSFSIANPENGNLPRSAIYANNSATQGLSITGCNFPGSTAYGTGAIITGSTATLSTGANSYGASAVGKGGSRGIASVANGGTIPINLARTPTYYQVTPTVAGHVAVVTAASATSLTVSLQTNAGAAVTTAESVSYIAEI